jgi:hypothetical protein
MNFLPCQNSLRAGFYSRGSTSDGVAGLKVSDPDPDLVTRGQRSRIFAYISRMLCSGQRAAGERCAERGGNLSEATDGKTLTIG